MRFRFALATLLLTTAALVGCASGDDGLGGTSTDAPEQQPADTTRTSNDVAVTVDLRARDDLGVLHLQVERSQQPYSTIVHTYFVARDRSALSFLYAEEIDPGSYEVEVPPMTAGTYDVTVEITGGNGHEHERSRFIQTFPLGIEGVPTPDVEERARRLGLADTPPEVAPAGRPSSFEFTTLVEGEPVAWGNPYVHQFVVGVGNDFFRHDHPTDTDILGLGSMRSSFTFPEPGEYVVFLFVESGLEFDGGEIYPVLRHPSVFEVPAG